MSNESETDIASPRPENELASLPTNPPSGLCGIMHFRIVSGHNLVVNRWVGKASPKAYLTAGRTVRKGSVAKGGDCNPTFGDEEWSFELEPHDSTMSLRVFDDHVLSPALIGYCVHYLTDFKNCDIATRFELHLIDNSQKPVGTVMVDARFEGVQGPTTISGLQAVSKVLFHGHLESFTGQEFLSKWRRKMLSEAELKRRWSKFYYIVAVGSSRASTGLFLFTSDAPESEVRGFFNLARFHCNCKFISCPKGEDESWKYLQLIQNPDRQQDMPLIVRCGVRDPKQRKVLSNFAAACNERIRKENPFAVKYVRAFDHEMFSVSNAASSDVDDIPDSFVQFVTRYMECITSGIPQEGKVNEDDRANLFLYMQELLDEILSSTAMDENCFRCARTFSGFAAAVTRMLMCSHEVPLQRAELERIDDGDVVWGHLQSLQEYQLRQLVEFALFQDRHEAECFSKWAMGLDEIGNLQTRVDLNKAKFASNMEHHDLNKAKWFLQIQVATNSSFNDVASLAGLFMPGLDMIQAMGNARTMSQKVRMWAEALVTCTGIINNTNESTNPIGAEDVPSLVLFLTCAVDTLPIKCGIAAQAKIANLFCLDSMATDEQRFQLPAGGLYVDVGDQYAFNAEKRAMSPQFSLLWLDDVLLMIADEEEMTAGNPISPRSAQFAQQNGSSVLPNEMDEQLAAHSPQTANELEDIAACFDDMDKDKASAGAWLEDSPPEMGANSEEASEASSVTHDDQQHNDEVLTEAVTDETPAPAPQSTTTIAEDETHQPAALEPAPAEDQQDEQASNAEHVQQDSQVKTPDQDINIDF